MALLATAGSAVGVALGWGLERLVPTFLGDLIPDLPLAGISIAALFRGLGLGLGVALLFGLPPLLAALRVPAARVLRREIEPLPAGRLVTLGLAAILLGGLVSIAALQARSLALGAAFAGGLAATALVLALSALALMKLSQSLPRLHLPLLLRHGIAALGRPGAATVGSIVALGLGTTVLVGMRAVERGLGDRLRADLPTARRPPSSSTSSRRSGRRCEPRSPAPAPRASIRCRWSWPGSPRSTAGRWRSWRASAIRRWKKTRRPTTGRSAAAGR